MKRLLAALVVSFSLSALAAPQKTAVVVRVTDTASLVSAASKVGEFIGNPMLVMPLTMGIPGNPAVTFFGPGRAGAATVLTVSVDPEKAGGSMDALADALHLAVLYPVTKGKADFLAAHPGAVEQDGVIRMTEPKDAFVAFSDDGAWVAMSDDAAQARTALAGTVAAAVPMNGDLVQLSLTPDGMALLARFTESSFAAAASQLPKRSQEAAAEALKLLRQIRSCDASVRVDDRGLAIQAKVLPVAGSDYAKLAPEPLAAGDALAFAGTDAVYACAHAKDCAQGDFDAAWTLLTGFVARQGLDMSWLACTKQDAARTLTFDFDGCATYFRTTGKAKFDALDPQTVVKDFEALAAQTKGPSIAGPAGALAIAFKGVDTKVSPSARFARIVPEAKAMKPYMISVGSVYSALRALAPKASALLPAEESASVQPLLQTLPPDGPGGIASYAWRTDDALHGAVRISPDEIKGLSTLIMTGAAYWQMQKANAMQMDASDAADDEF